MVIVVLTFDSLLCSWCCVLDRRGWGGLGSVRGRRILRMHNRARLRGRQLMSSGLPKRLIPTIPRLGKSVMSAVRMKRARLDRCIMMNDGLWHVVTGLDGT